MTASYSTATLVKAVLAFIVGLIGAAGAAATEKTGGPDVTVLTPAAWVATLIPALTAGLALLHKPVSKNDATPNAVAVSSVTDVVNNAVKAHGDLVQQAIDGIQKVQQATGELSSLLPVQPLQPGLPSPWAPVDAGRHALDAVGLSPLTSLVIHAARL